MADIDFSWMEDLLTGDDADYSSLFDDVTDLTPSMPDTGIGAFDFSDLFNDDEDYSYLFDDVTDLDFDYDLGVDFSDVYDNLFNEDTNYDDTVKELYPSLFDPFKGSIEEPNWLDTILGFVGGKEGKNKAQGIMGGVGDVVNSPLGQMALLNYLKNQREQDIKIPIGQEAYGGGQGLGSMPDYRIFNLQPALMPGVGYANAPPPGMKDGGLTGLSQKIGEGVDNYAISPYLAEVGFFEDPSFAKYVEGARLYNQNTKAPGIFKSVAPFMDDSFEALQDGYEAFLKSFKEKRGLGSLQGETETMQEITMQEMKHGGLKDGPGDITLARLEPGEFVMTRKATDNIGAKNLYSLMKQAERMG